MEALAAEAGEESHAAPGWARLTGQGALAVLDQGLFAGTNFVFNILLARWLSEAEYGVFAIGYAVLTLTVAFHGALVVEPMLVFGPKWRLTERGHYVGALALLTSGLGLLMGAVLFGVPGLLFVGLVPGHPEALLGFALAVPLLHLTSLGRRLHYLRGSPAVAVLGSSVFAGGGILGLLVVSEALPLGVGSALLVYSLAAGLGALPMLWLGGLSLPRPASMAGLLRKAIGMHWAYGKWSTGVETMRWAPGHLYYFLLPAVVGIGGTATFRAANNLVTPLVNVNVAISLLLLPIYVRRGEADSRAMVDLVRKQSALFGMGAALYLGFLAVAGGAIFDLLYAGQYQEGVPAAVALGAAMIPVVMATVLEMGLRAFERPDLVFRGSVAALAATLLVGVAAAILAGVMGAAIGIGVAGSARLVVVYLLLDRLQRRRTDA